MYPVSMVLCLNLFTRLQMKKLLSLLAVVFTLGLSTVSMDADAAKRLGSGKSMGMQRQATPDKAPSASPNQAAAAPAAAGAAGAAAAPKRSWMGPLAGLAAGLGLAALASHLGFGDELASMVMFGLLAAAIMVAVGFFMRKRAAARQQPMAQGAGGMQYAPIGGAAPAAPAAPAYKTSMPPSGGSMIGSALGSSAAPATGSRIPADFDVAGFSRNAKVNFIRLQASGDAGNLSDIREFTTPEMFAELKMELAERGGAVHHTDVVSIEADVIDVEETDARYVVSVRFTGEIREEAGAAAEPFNEVWHLVKPRQGAGGWLLAGIQQAQ
jgi:predicted lipid-binding transport protein (Tim44 family)